VNSQNAISFGVSEHLFQLIIIKYH
jgi:hypothetical protein